MANIVRRNGGSIQQAIEPMDPLRMMRDLMRWDPFREMAPLIARPMREMYEPGFDIRETDDAFVIEGDLPGIKPDDVEVMVTGNRLQISGKREVEEEAKQGTYYCSERFFGQFTRAFTLPEGIDADQARSEFRDGVLKIVLPKRAEAQPKRIALGGGGGGGKQPKA